MIRIKAGAFCNRQPAPNPTLRDVHRLNLASLGQARHAATFAAAYFNGFAFTVEQMLPLIPIWGTDQTYNDFARTVGLRDGHSLSLDQASRLAPGRHTDRHGRDLAEAHNRRRWGVRNQFHHVIDVAPTIPDAIGIPQPTMINGIAQRPYDGVSMVYTSDKANANAPSTRKTQYFEIFGHRAIYHDGWIANTVPAVTPWEGVKGRPPVDVMNGYKPELFNLADDPTQTNGLSAKEPERLRMMQELWIMEAT